MRLNFWESEDAKEREEGISVKEIKKLLKEKGGYGWTEHYERDGTMFESTPILLKSNAKMAYGIKYNKHL